jgi:hypothetical protein
MNILLQKKFVSPKLNLRFFSVLTFAVGVASVFLWQSNPPLSRILVHLRPEPVHYTSEQKTEVNPHNCFIDGSHTGAEINGADLQGVKFHKVDFRNAHIISSNFSDANFSKANLSHAQIFYSSFINTNFNKANLYRARFHASDLTGSDLIETNLVGANLSYSDLNDARLNNANLTDANLIDTRLETAIGLTYEQLEKAVISKFTTLPPHLEAKRGKLMQKSRRNVERIKRKISEAEYEVWKHPFFDVD